jgi:hypothetical protein
MTMYTRRLYPELYGFEPRRPASPGKHPDKGTLYWHTDGSWPGVTARRRSSTAEIDPLRDDRRARSHILRPMYWRPTSG